MIQRAELLFSEVLNTLSQITKQGYEKGLPNSNVKSSESRHQIAELEAILQKEKAEFEVSLHVEIYSHCFTDKFTL